MCVRRGGCLGDRSNPVPRRYHSRIHAADVVHGVYWILQVCAAAVRRCGGAYSPPVVVRHSSRSAAPNIARRAAVWLLAPLEFGCHVVCLLSSTISALLGGSLLTPRHHRIARPCFCACRRGGSGKSWI